MDFISSQFHQSLDNDTFSSPVDFKDFLNQFQHLSFVLGRNGDVEWINKIWSKLGECSNEEIMSKEDTVFLFFKSMSFLDFKKLWLKANFKKTPFETEVSLSFKNQELLWYKLSVTPVLRSSSEVIAWVATLFDISAYKKLENDLHTTLKSRDEFISVASHELKTPLTTLRLEAQIIKKTLSKGETLESMPGKINKLLSTVERQTSRLNRLIDDMLDISRMRTGHLSIRKNLINLNDLVKDVFDKMVELHPDKKPLMSFIGHSQSIYGYWDRIRIEQVISNLISNAIKYGDGKPFKIELFSSDEHAILKVQDHGIGIPKDKLRKIFERYERGQKLDGAISGLGLGLYISEQIVLAHGGRIWAESDKEPGSIFVVELPLVKPS